MSQDSLFIFPFQHVPVESYVPVYNEDDTLSIAIFHDPPGLVSLATQAEIRQPRPDFGEIRPDTDRDWITIVLAAAFVLFAFAKYNFPKRLVELIKACFFLRAVALLYKKTNPFNEQITLILSIIYLLTSSLFVFLIIEDFGWEAPETFRKEWFIAAIILANAVYWLSKATIMRIMAHIFKTGQATTGYLLNNLLFNMALGLFLLIALPLVVYTGSDIVIKITLTITVALLIYKVLRSILVGLSITHFPIFYLILYICALEAAPLLIIAKLFMTYGS